MANRFIFADEAGCFTFKAHKGASKYFLLCTLTTDDCSLSNDLLDFRRELALSNEADRDKLHASEDRQHVRDRVFEILSKHTFRIDATIFEKAKAQPQICISAPIFYQYAWFYHMKHLAPTLIDGADKILITAAALGTNKTKAAFKLSVNNTVQQIIPRAKWEVSFLDSANDPLLWAVDYCAWAIQRKWEMGDDRSHKLIMAKIKTEFDIWANGTKRYY